MEGSIYSLKTQKGKKQTKFMSHFSMQQIINYTWKDSRFIRSLAVRSMEELSSGWPKRSALEMEVDP